MVAGRRAGKVLVGILVLALLAGGCSVVRGAVSTIRALDKAGFNAADIQPGNETDGWEVTVEKDTEDLDAAAVEAAGVVWRKLPLRIERLEVTCGNGFGGKGTFAADRDELEQRFGARDPDLDRGIQESDLRTVALVLAGLALGGLLVLGGIVTLIVVLVRRNRKRNPPAGPWGPSGPGGPSGPRPGGDVSQPSPPHYGPRP
jgi:hypothetical protein